MKLHLRGDRKCRVIVAILLATLAMVWTPSRVPGQEAPENPAERRAREFVEVVNSGDTNRMRQFVQEVFSKGFLEAIPPEEHVRILTMTYQQEGGFDIRRVSAPGPNAADVIVQGRRTKEWSRMNLRVEDTPPYRIAGIGIMPTTAIALEYPDRPLSDDEMVAFLKRVLDSAAAQGQFSGAVLVAKNGQPIFKAAYGLASRRYNVPNQVDTKFNLGSMNKMFTAVAIAQLAEQGKLSFSDPIGKYLTGWVSDSIGRKVTIQNLLTHTSGLGSYFNEKFMKSSRELYRKVDDYKSLVADEKLAFEPGTKWQYSNTGFLLLGAIVEKASGQDYFDYIREHVYKPAGMSNSDCYDMDDPVPNLAMGYTKSDGKWKNNIFMHVIRGGPAGGGFSTVEDLLAFANALMGNKLLKPEMTRLLTTAKPELHSPNYGFGFGVEENPHSIGHSGGFPGISSNLSIFPDSGFTVAVMSNTDGGSVEVANLFRHMLNLRAKRQT